MNVESSPYVAVADKMRMVNGRRRMSKIPSHRGLPRTDQRTIDLSRTVEQHRNGPLQKQSRARSIPRANFSSQATAKQ